MDSVDLAKYIIGRLNILKAKDNKFEYNNTKIQKLLFIIYGFCWASSGLRLLNEQPKLWPYGPVFPRVFKYIQKNGFDSECNVDFMNLIKPELIDKILEIYGKYPAGTLSDWSHQEGSPWYLTKKDMEESYGKQIEGQPWSGWNKPLYDNYIQDYFSKIKVLSNE